ncbi:23S rRNA (uracil(1939)-C(5))-methyltransferase RlmD [Kordiimonas aestuarii]|uniref:23S rRNA (uracil(1939)-C(5))-methyltransferase RlmD n=1 Tax=Kordiimonas aestuarii TaxID=1005925 RepID=UPI0021D0C3C4|nr:23S rRNA (uracil(1939)-C(5))-methyltransferase RlmD [Kordiimonas aestuarii]
MAADILEVTITSIGAQGDGIASHDGVPVFVPFAMPGDVARVIVKDKRRNGIYSELLEIVSESESRRAPVCAYFGACGGCQLQYMDAKTYSGWVKNRAVLALKQHGFDDVPVLDPVITPPASRRRVALKALKVAAGVVLGFNERQSHQIVDVTACPVTREELTALFEPLRRVLDAVFEAKMAATVHMTLTASGVDMMIDAPMALGLAARERLVEFAHSQDVASLHWRDQGFLDPVAIRREPVMDFAGVKVPLPPAAFIQATDEGEAALVKAVVDGCRGFGRVADLFSGIGTFTLPLAREHQVMAAEGARDALDALKAGVLVAPDLKQVITRHRDLFRQPISATELEKVDAVVFDPPRAGAAAQVAEVAKSDVKRVVAVSCNPNTFSRDARTLADSGYVLEGVLPVDQFLWSSHLELVGTFTRL